MKTKLLFALVSAGLLLLAMGPVAADPWPSWDASGYWPYYTVSISQDGSDPNIWVYTVSVDPLSLQPGWAIKAFVPFASGISGYGVDQGWTGYDGGNTAGWTNLNGGWEWGKLDPNDRYSNAAFGWQTGSGYIYSGQTATFYANLGTAPTGWDLSRTSVHVVSPEGGTTFWATNVPEPSSLALLGVGIAAAASWTGLRKKRRSQSR
jgi:hypothetical protein